MAFPLENQTIVLTGEFDAIDAENAKWNLISKGARVTTSVTKTTAVVLAGPNPKKSILDGAGKHGTPVLGEEALRALLDGATVAQAICAGTAEAAPSGHEPLTGRTVVVAGRLPKAVHASLVRLGASVSKKVSSKTDLLILAGPPGFEAIDALNSGIPFLLPDDLTDLERGAPFASYVGKRDLPVPDASAFVSQKLVDLEDRLVAIDMGGEVWRDELTLTIHPNGRLSARLRELGGTPTEDHVRRVLQREDWPRVSTPCVVSRPIVFGPRDE
jgi:BRCT domain type II-containing protein